MSAILGVTRMCSSGIGRARPLGAWNAVSRLRGVEPHFCGLLSPTVRRWQRLANGGIGGPQDVKAQEVMHLEASFLWAA